MSMSKVEDNYSGDNFFIVDFDRTLVDSDKLFEVFLEISNRYITIPIEQIELAQQDIRQRGDSFDTAGYVRDCLNKEGRRDEWEKLIKLYIHESRSLNYLLPGAHELIEWLKVQKKSYGILTYGNPMWQHLKIAASGFKHVNHIITEEKAKGKIITSWKQQDGRYKLPEAFGSHVVEAIRLIDDKAVSFTSFPPEPSRGYWVIDPSNELPSQLGPIPENTKRYDNLYAVLQTLKSSG